MEDNAIGFIKDRWQQGDRAVSPHLGDVECLGDQADICAEFPATRNMMTVDASGLALLIKEMSEERSHGQYYLRGFIIKGRLSLEYMTGPLGTPLPSLVLVQCLFESGICFSGARLKNLSLRGSRFLIDESCGETDFGERIQHINGRRAELAGNLDLSHIRPIALDDDDTFEHYDSASTKVDRQRTTCSLMGVKIQGALLAKYSTFAEVDIHAHLAKDSLGSPPYAFNIAGSKLGQLTLSPGYSVNGGLGAGQIDCLGEAWLAGSNLNANYIATSESEDQKKGDVTKRALRALNLQSASIRRAFILSLDLSGNEGSTRSATIDGNVFCVGLRAASIYATGLHIKSSKQPQGIALNFDNLVCDYFELGEATSSEITKQFGETDSSAGLVSALTFRKVTARSATINFLKARNRGIYFETSRIGNLQIKCRKADFIRITGKYENVIVDGYCEHLDMAGCIVEQECQVGVEARQIELQNIRVGADLDLYRWTTRPVLEEKSSRLNQPLIGKGSHRWPTLLLSRARIGGSLSVGYTEKRESLAAHSFRLKCYPGWELILSETRSKSKAGEYDFREEFVAYLSNEQNPDKPVRLDGSAQLFSESTSKYNENGENIERNLLIDDKEKAIEYLVLATSFRWGQEGPFRLVTSEQLRPDVGRSGSKPENGSEIVRKDSPLVCSLLCKNSAGEEKYKQVPADIRAFTDLDSLLETEELNFSVTNSMDSQAKDTDQTEEQQSESVERYFVDEIRGFCHGKSKEDSNDEFDESKFLYFLTATVIYAHHIFVALFGIRKEPYGEIDLLIDFPVCKIEGFEKKATRDSNKAEEVDENELTCRVRDYREFREGDGGLGMRITIESKAGPGKLRSVDYLPPEYFTPRSLEGIEKKIATWTASGRGRKALVDLSDAKVDSLDDGNGRGWGDELFFKTDRFQFNSIQKRDSWTSSPVESPENNDNGGNGTDVRLTIDEILEEFPKTPDELDMRLKLRLGVNYVRNPFLRFYEERLIWMCRYHRDFDNTSQSAPKIDGGTFRRVARIYRKLGLPDSAKYIDEARLLRESQERITRLEKQVWSMPFTGLLKISGLLAVFLLISSWNNLAGWDVAVISAITFTLLWNQVTRHVVKKVATTGLRMWNYLFRNCFRYGLSLKRPLATVFCFLAIGWWTVHYLDDNGFMVVEATVTSHLVGSAPLEASTPYIGQADTASLGRKVSDIECGNTIDYALYSIDVFIPLIELDQEERCLIRPFDSNPPRNDVPYSAIFSTDWIKGSSSFCSENSFTGCHLLFPWHVVTRHPTSWRIAQALFMLLGWVLVSATLLTFSGYLRRQAEGDD